MSEDLTGQTLGAYKLVALVGRGQLSSIYRGYDKAEDRYATLKVLPAVFLTDEPDFLERFRHEALHLAELTHPAILVPTDVDAAQDRPYLVLPSMPGGSLADRLQHAPLPLLEIGHIFTPIAGHSHKKSMHDGVGYRTSYQIKPMAYSVVYYHTKT